MSSNWLFLHKCAEVMDLNNLIKLTITVLKLMKCKKCEDHGIEYCNNHGDDNSCSKLWMYLYHKEVNTINNKSTAPYEQYKYDIGESLIIINDYVHLLFLSLSIGMIEFKIIKESLELVAQSEITGINSKCHTSIEIFYIIYKKYIGVTSIDDLLSAYLEYYQTSDSCTR